MVKKCDGITGRKTEAAQMGVSCEPKGLSSGGHPYQAAAYVRPGTLPDRKSLHLALRKGDGGWKSLNFGIGVLFAEADYAGAHPAGVTRVLEDPVLYRRADGRIGAAARCCGIRRTQDGAWERDAGPGAEPQESGSKTEENRSKTEENGNEMRFWATEDLVSWQPAGQEDAAPSAGASDPFCTARRTLLIDGEPVSASILCLTEEEADALEKKLGEVRNVSVDPVEVHIPAGEVLTDLPPMKAHYSDGSSEEIPVEWDWEELAAIPFDREGVYEVTGRAAVKEYAAPLIGGLADPAILYWKGLYWLTGTNEHTGGRDLYLRCAGTVEGLAEAEPRLIFRAAEAGDHSGCNWAPELHVIGGRLCCLFASSLNGQWDHVQSRIMYCGGSPLERESWSEPVRIRNADGSWLMEDADGITLDMTYFEAAGRSYYCWAQREIRRGGSGGQEPEVRMIGSSDLMIAPVDPSAPERLAGEAVRLCRPGYAWDRQDTEVDEGPHVLKHGGMLYLTFSGDAVSGRYCMGLLTAQEDADLLDPASWTRTGYPVLGREHVPGEPGPGHNSFTKDEYGRDVLIYHAWPEGGLRSFYARTVHYGADGTPLFYLTPERFLQKRFRQVKARVTVEKPAYLFVHFREKTTPDGEQVHFGLSRDGFLWESVNGGAPLLWAYYGDKGVRDFTAVRCEHTGKFHIFATDLSLSYGMRGQYRHSWEQIGRNGSRYLAVWESSDLVHWSEEALLPFGGTEFGCRWAPDILHDPANGDYLLHWSSPHVSDGYRDKAIYYSRTRDFRHFTEPALLYRKADSGVIDSALYAEDGRYYLFVKSEKNPCGVILLSADRAEGPYEMVEGFWESMALENAGAYEAPTAVRLADGRWCLFLDYFGVKGKGQGYVPFVADRLAGGRFVRADEAFSFPYGFKHGTILKITQAEYERIREFDWTEPPDLR